MHDLIRGSNLIALILRVGTLQTRTVSSLLAGPVPVIEVTRQEGEVHMDVDHSHFTASRTMITLPDENLVPTISAAVHSAIIDRQQFALRMLASVNAEVINSLDKGEIVRNVLRAVMRVIPHSDGGVFRLFDKATGYLIPVSHEGLPKEYRNYTLLPNESVSGSVFSTGKAALFNSRDEIVDAHVVMRPESQSFMERSRIANALMCAPVVAGGRCLGTLTSLSFSDEGRFSAFDLTLLESLATQIAVAYQRSHAYQVEVAASRRLEEMHRDLAQKNDDLDRVVSLHQTLLQIFSTAAPLADQLDDIATLFEVSFRFESVFGMVHEADWIGEKDALVQDVYMTDAAVGQFLIRRTRDETFLRALFGTVATFVALDFVRDVSRIDIRNASRKAHFQNLIAAGELARSKVSHGFRADRFNQIYVTRLADETPQGRIIAQQTVLARLHKLPVLGNSLIFYEDDRVICLLSRPTATSLASPETAIADLAEHDRMAFGASEIYDQPALHAEARDQATDAADALLRRGKTGLLHQHSLGVERLLKGRSKRDILDFSHTILKPLTKAEHLPLLDTMAAYVRHARSPSKASTELGIHPNTLYQRLDRIETLTGHRLSDPDDFLMLGLACQLLALYGGADVASATSPD